jgi:antitoxin MazE
MKVSLIDIGTSKGIRIPASVLKEMDRPDAFELELKGGEIHLKALKQSRNGWEEKFRNAGLDESLLIDDALDLEEWNAL